MEELIAKYSKVPAKQRYALVALGVVGLVAGYYYGYHIAVAERLDSVKSQYRALEAERAEKQAYVDNLAKYEARLNELQQDLNAARAQLPDAADVPQLLAQLGNKGRQSGLSISRWVETSCSINPIGKSGARSSGPMGWWVPGCSTGGMGSGRSAWMLYQTLGISFSLST